MTQQTLAFVPPRDIKWDSALMNILVTVKKLSTMSTDFWIHFSIFIQEMMAWTTILSIVNNLSKSIQSNQDTFNSTQAKCSSRRDFPVVLEVSDGRGQRTDNVPFLLLFISASPLNSTACHKVFCTNTLVDYFDSALYIPAWGLHPTLTTDWLYLDFWRTSKLHHALDHIKYPTGPTKFSQESQVQLIVKKYKFLTLFNIWQ